MTTSAPPRTSFEHLGMFYRDAGQYLAGTVAFVRAALAAGRPVLVAVPGANVELLRPELPAHGAELTFLDMHAAGRNPGRIIPAVLLAFAAGHPGRRVAIVGEPS